MTIFKKELTALINSKSLENGSDTPDWILAEYMMNCLRAFETAILDREAWYGRAGNQKITSSKVQEEK